MTESSAELAHLNALSGEEQENSELNTEQYLTFSLGEEEYGVDILRVQEIKSWVDVTFVPNTPDYLCGVLNLRGAIIPIVDLRLRMDMDKRDYDKTTIVIVIKVRDEQEETEKTVGIVVDVVSDAYDIKRDEIKPRPDLGEQVDTTYILGLVALSNRMVMILDVDVLLGAEAMA